LYKFKKLCYYLELKSEWKLYRIIIKVSIHRKWSVLLAILPLRDGKNLMKLYHYSNERYYHIRTRCIITNAVRIIFHSCFLHFVRFQCFYVQLKFWNLFRWDKYIRCYFRESVRRTSPSSYVFQFKMEKKRKKNTRPSDPYNVRWIWHGVHVFPWIFVKQGRTSS